VLHWAWIVTAVLAPELLATHIYRTRLVKFRSNHPELAKILKTFFGALNVFLLITANMVGYVFGIEGLTTVITNTNIAASVGGVFAFFFCGVQAMLWLEKRRQSHQTINLK
jgi:hypothetical protein